MSFRGLPNTYSRGILAFTSVMVFGLKLGRCDEIIKQEDVLKKVHATDVAAYGSNILVVLPGPGPINFGQSLVSTLTIQDVDAIAKGCPAVTAVTPVVTLIGKAEFKGRTWVTQCIHGTTRSYLTVRDWTKLKEGVEFSDNDIRDGKPVCLLGQTVADELTKDASPLGHEISVSPLHHDINVKARSFRVVGVLTKKCSNAMGRDGNDVILVPRRTVTGLLDTATHGKDKVDAIWAKAASTEKMPVAMEEITKLLRERHRLTQRMPDDFNFRDITHSMEKGLEGKDSRKNRHP